MFQKKSRRGISRSKKNTRQFEKKRKTKEGDNRGGQVEHNRGGWKSPWGEAVRENEFEGGKSITHDHASVYRGRRGRGSSGSSGSGQGMIATGWLVRIHGRAFLTFFISEGAWDEMSPADSNSSQSSPGRGGEHPTVHGGKRRRRQRPTPGPKRNGEP